MNKVMLCGRLTKEPEVRYSGETAIANYTLAVDRRRAKNSDEQADFLRCTAFGKQAEFAEKYLKKGIKIIVIGRIQTSSYTDKNGNKAYSTSILVDEHEFVESKKASEEAQQGEAEGFMTVPQGIDLEDLPFA